MSDLISIVNEAIPLKKKEDLQRRLDLYVTLTKVKEYNEKKIKRIVENSIPLRSCAFGKAEDRLTRIFLMEQIKKQFEKELV